MHPLLFAALLATDTTRYVILNHGREAGEMIVAKTADTVTLRYEHVDRNRGVVSAKRYRIDRTGRVMFGESMQWVFGGPIGSPADRFEVVRDSILWGITPPQRGSAVIEPDMFPRLRSAPTPYDQALLAKFLLARPDKRGRAMPGATPLRAEVLATTTVGPAAARKRVRLVAVYTGTSYTPGVVWLDDRSELFAGGVDWFIPVRVGSEAALPALRTIEMKWRNAQALALGKTFPRPTAGNTVVIKDGDVFDSERGVILPQTTIVIQGDRIVSVGAEPASIQSSGEVVVIDARGKTVMPGMWDMHGHLVHTSQTTGSIQQLANGLTTVRDLASDLDIATWYRDKINSGELVGARPILSGFIEGPGKWAGPGDVIVRTEAEARRWVARFDSMGYRQIKLYNLVHPDLVPTIADETHKRGMRLSGHVPRGLSVPAAIALGFDEINHAAFLFSTFFQDSLYTPTMRAYSLVATTVSPNVDVNDAGFTSLIDYLRSHNTVIDGTFNLWAGTTQASSSGTVPNRGVENYLRLIQRLDSAGVVLVPGTDNTSGSTYITELETYIRAGLPPTKVLQMATIVSARVMRDDKDYGSITPGKVADIVIVNGRPHERIADLRNIDRVIRAGRVYTPTALREAMGIRVAQPGAPR